MHFQRLWACCLAGILAFAVPSFATISEFGAPQGLSGQTTALPGAEVVLYVVPLVNNGQSSLQAVTLTLEDLSTGTGIASSAFNQLRVYRSTDSTLTSAVQIGSQSTVNLGAPTTILLDSPDSTSVFPYYITTVVLNTVHTDETGAAKDAFRVGVAAGALSTSDGAIGSAITADDANRVTIDVVGTRLSFSTQPDDAGAVNGDVVSSQAFATQPVVRVEDAAGNLDVDYAEPVNMALASGAGTLTGTSGVAAANGSATFTNLAYTATADQESFSLTATSGSLTQATSTGRTADVIASRFVFTTQPVDAGAINGNVVSGQAFATQPIVQARDADDLRDQNFSGQINMVLGSGAGSLSGTLNATAAAGQAQFSGLAYTVAAVDQESFTLTATSGSLTQATSAARTADVVATRVVFTGLPADPAATNGNIVSGQVFVTQPVLQAQNDNNILDVNYSAGTVQLAAQPIGITLAGNDTKAWSNGIADFAGQALAATATDDQEVFSLTASSGSLTPATSSNLTADVVATQLTFAVLPTDPAALNGDVVSGQVFTTQPVVRATDADGIRDIHINAGSATLQINSGTVTLNGTTTVNWSTGQASFTNLSATAGSDQETFTLRATSTGLTEVVTGNLTADVVATQLAFAVLPTDLAAANGNVVSGQVFATQPVLEARDAAGVLDQNIGSGSATLAVQSGAVTLAGTATENWSAGRADFSGNGLSITSSTDGSVFVLSGSSAGLAQVSTSSLVSDVVATQLVFTTSPAHSGVVAGDVINGVAFATQPVVQAQNAADAVDADFTDQVALAVDTPGQLSGTLSVAAVAGVVQFANVAYVAAADQESFQLRADDTSGGSEGDLPAATDPATLSADVVATQIVFTVPPADGTAANGNVVNGQVFATQPVVEAQDAGGLRDLNFSGSVALSSSAVTLSGTTSKSWFNGRADFAGSQLQVAATVDSAVFALTAQSAGIQGQAAGLVADAVATQLAFAVLPTDPAAANGDVVNGQPFASQPVVEAQNAAAVRDLDVDSGSATLSVGSGAVSLSGATARTWNAGRADFAGLDVSVSGSGDGASFTLSAQATGLPSVTTSTLVSDVVATQLIFATSPAHAGVAFGAVISGTAFATQPSVEGRDAGGQVDIHFIDQVTLSIDPPGQLGGTTTAAATAGRAQFTNLVYRAAADQEVFQLKADDQTGGGEGDLPQATDAAQVSADVVASQLVFTTQADAAAAINGDVVNGQPFATQPVCEVQDADGIRDVNFAAPVNLSIASGNVTLSGDPSENVVGGIADFSANNLAVSGSADGIVFTLAANATGLAQATGPAQVNDVVATQIVFVTEPADAAAINGDVVNGQSFATQPVLEARDANAIRDLHISGTSVALSVAATDVALTGTTALNWANGIADFAGANLTTTGADGANFTLTASSSSLPDTAIVLINDVVASQLVFTVSPIDAAAVNGDVVNGQPFATQPTVEAQDQNGNRDVDVSGTLNLSISSGAVTLTGQTAAAWGGGRADFNGANLTTTGADGANFTLTASSSSLPDTAIVLINDVVASQLVFTVSPIDAAAVNGDVVNGQPFATQPTVEAQDQNGNRDVDVSGTLNLSISSGAVTLTGQTAAAWVGGRADFNGANLTVNADQDGDTFTLTAAAATLPDTAIALVNDAVATQLVFARQPAHSGVPSGTVIHALPFETQPIIEAQDGNGVRDKDLGRLARYSRHPVG